MGMVNRIFKRRIHFRKIARTSRNQFTHRDLYIVELRNYAGETGYGECAPLRGLSLDDVVDFEERLLSISEMWNAGKDPDLHSYPSIRFGFEVALRHMNSGNAGALFEQSFTTGNPIPINGLVWMDDAETMYREANQKAEEGYTCLKFKVGALGFDEELNLIRAIREKYSAEELVIRLDANGAFAPEDALYKLEQLAKFDIHSIEQPIRPGQISEMKQLCITSPIPIALDEELIGVNVFRDGYDLLSEIQPGFIVLKPNLIGGFRISDAWADLAELMGIGWWATSALESNLGLNAIAQWTASRVNGLLQGLGTGSLYTDNLEGPLFVTPGYLNYRPEMGWNYSEFLRDAELIADFSSENRTG